MTDMVAGVRKVLVRDLDALAAQISAYPKEDDIWKTVAGIANPGGTLALHLVGNLRAFIGAEMGRSGYVRDRDAEFSARDVSRTEILARIEIGREIVAAAKPFLAPARMYLSCRF